MLCTFLVGLSIQSAQAQGFSSFNGRNHPELDWQQAETEHFKIMYPAHLAGIEMQAGVIAETTYTALSQNLDVTFDEKIRIYLSDEDEILNGFAVSLLGYTNIWVHVNDVAASWSGNTKWLRTVISHELAHLFHGKAVKSRLGLAAYFLGDPMPSFWAEGLAQYETEKWDANRGDRWLRTAVLDDKLSYEDGRSIWNGRLLYASGNSQLRFLASQYGDSTITKILKHRKYAAFGRFAHHDFFTAFEDVTGQGYRTFYEEWRRHMNVYYNTLAGQMELPDSLDAKPLKLGGQYVYDIKYSPDTTHAAVLSLASISRPVVRLQVIHRETGTAKTVADGSIRAPIAWHPEGRQLAFTRRTRQKNGALINDLFVTSRNGKNTKRLTRARRASAPAFSPDGTQLAFIGSAGGTANVFLYNLSTGEETPLTTFTGDVQLASLDWHHAANMLVVGRFDADGDRDILLLNPKTGEVATISPTGTDDQYPVWSPDGKQIAVTSLSDRVPNVFIWDLETRTRRRATNLITGAQAFDWLPADSLHAKGTLIVTTSASKQRDRAYRIDAARVPFETEITIPASYSRWTTHTPGVTIPATVDADESVITKRSPYKSIKNLVHLFSFGLPYYNNADDWGVIGATSWTEPLGHHTFGATASLALKNTRENSFLLATYVNNQLRPTSTLSAYSLLPTARAYGNNYLLDEVSGADVTFDWPLDIAVKPYTGTRLDLRLQYAAIDQLNPEDYESLPAGLLPPQQGEKAELRLGFIRKKLRPYSGNVVHPLDGRGIKLQVAVSDKIFGGDTRYLRADAAAYAVLPTILANRLFVYGKATLLSGNTFNQERPGFARFDDIQITAPQFGIMAFSDATRVRGYREFAYGDRVLFGTAEYRMPVLPSLQTTILGLISLRQTTLSAFIDAGAVWEDGVRITRRTGAGIEAKNALVIGGVLQLMHAVGIAQPTSQLGTTDDYEVYYRVRASLPF
ncbi:MAG: hypothetical protein AAF564_08195 [Bacteroidota bacterium]